MTKANKNAAYRNLLFQMGGFGVDRQSMSDLARAPAAVSALAGSKQLSADDISMLLKVVSSRFDWNKDTLATDVGNKQLYEAHRKLLCKTKVALENAFANVPVAPYAAERAAQQFRPTRGKDSFMSARTAAS